MIYMNMKVNSKRVKKMEKGKLYIRIQGIGMKDIFQKIILMEKDIIIGKKMDMNILVIMLME